jgi:hypothetical protein
MDDLNQSNTTGTNPVSRHEITPSNAVPIFFDEPPDDPMRDAVDEFAANLQSLLNRLLFCGGQAVKPVCDLCNKSITREHFKASAADRQSNLTVATVLNWWRPKATNQTGRNKEQ